MLIDTHCHINLNAFRADGAETLQRALDADVAVVNVGTQLDTSKQAVALLDQFPANVYAAVGLHPTHTFRHQYHDEEEVRRHPRSCPRFRAREAVRGVRQSRLGQADATGRGRGDLPVHGPRADHRA